MRSGNCGSRGSSRGRSGSPRNSKSNNNLESPQEKSLKKASPSPKGKGSRSSSPRSLAGKRSLSDAKISNTTTKQNRRLSHDARITPSWKENVDSSVITNNNSTKPAKSLVEQVKCSALSPRSKRTMSLDTGTKDCTNNEDNTLKVTKLKKFKSLDSFNVNKGENRPKNLTLMSESTTDLTEVSKATLKRRNSSHDALKLNEVLGNIAKDFKTNMDDTLYKKLESDLNTGNKSPEKANRSLKDFISSKKVSKKSQAKTVVIPSSLEPNVSPPNSSNTSPVHVPKKVGGKKLNDVVRNLQEKKRAESPLCFKETETPTFLKDFEPPKGKGTSPETVSKSNEDEKKGKSDVRHGEGVYLTELTPDTAKEEIAKNNYDGKKLDKVVAKFIKNGNIDYYIEVKLKQDKKSNLKKCDDTTKLLIAMKRNVWLYENDDINLATIKSDESDENDVESDVDEWSWGETKVSVEIAKQ